MSFQFDVELQSHDMPVLRVQSTNEVLLLLELYERERRGVLDSPKEKRERRRDEAITSYLVEHYFVLRILKLRSTKQLLFHHPFPTNYSKARNIICAAHQDMIGGDDHSKGK